MKISLGLISIMILLGSCKKDTYERFSLQELEFVSYSEGQELRFLDTFSTTRTFVQDAYERDFREGTIMFMPDGYLKEYYEVLYGTHAGNFGMGFSVALDKRDNSLEIDFNGYGFYANTDTLRPHLQQLTVNGVDYQNVYAWKVYYLNGTLAGSYGKQLYVNGQLVENTDTATLYHNRKYGFIQLLYPNGKRILRVD